MIEAIAPFLIISVTGAFFFVGIFAISRISKAAKAQGSDVGAPEGDLRSFHLRIVEDELRREDF